MEVYTSSEKWLTWLYANRSPGGSAPYLLLEIFSPSALPNGDMEKYFGRKPGAVDALTIPSAIPLFADKKLFEKELVVGSAGSPYAGLKLNPKEILKIQKPIIEDLAKT